MNVTLTFSNGRQLEAELNGDCYITDNPVSITSGLSHVSVTGKDYSRDYYNAQMIECASVDERFWFAFIGNVFNHNEVSPVEQSFTASRNYGAGELVTVENRLLEIISPIPRGCTIEIGKNAAEITMKEYIDKKTEG